ncbi:MAG: energy transducer TonB [Candidatus Sulfotelmatobacter sp.]
MRRFCLGRVLCGIALAIFFWAAVVECAASDLERHVRSEVVGKTFVLRGFYEGRSLRFGATGVPPEGTVVGDWTVSGIVQVIGAQVSKNRLTIRARRLHLGWLNGSFQDLHDYVGTGKVDKDENKERALLVELDLGGATIQTADDALARIFLTSQDSFADLVPSYWKPCVLAGVNAASGKEHLSCRFSAEFLAIPGVAHASDSYAENAQPAGSGAPQPVNVIGKGMTPPKVLSQTDPEFSDAARRARYQGTIVLKLVVDSSGSPKNLRVWMPLGCGLDAQAVRSVEGWKFRPGMKDGQPVAVELSVEVDFHLY